MADKDLLILFHVREHFIHAFRNQVQSNLLQPLYDNSWAPASTNMSGLRAKPYTYDNYPTTGSGNMYANTNVTATNLREALMSTVPFFRYMRTFRYGVIGNDAPWTSYANGFITDGYSWTLNANDFPGAGISSSSVWTNNDTMLNNQIVREIFNTMLGGVSGPARAILYWDSVNMHDRLATYVSKLATSGNSESDYPDLRVCHSSCHSNCHSSAPVVTPTTPPPTGSGYLAPLNPGDHTVNGSASSGNAYADFELSIYGYISGAGSPVGDSFTATWLPPGANASDYEVYWNYSGPFLSSMSGTSNGQWGIVSASATLIDPGSYGQGVMDTCYFTIRHRYDNSLSCTFNIYLKATSGTPTTSAPTTAAPGGGGGGGGCVSVASFLPDARRAGEVKVEDTMFLADQWTLEPGTGEVTASYPMAQPGYRIVTESGASLVCSSSAPIPVKDQLLCVKPADLLGELVAVRHDVDLSYVTDWEKVVEVTFLGTIMVQFITVGDKCFWAGEKKGAYILHHNYSMQKM